MTESGPQAPGLSRLARLPFYYGWIVVAVAFVTMAIGVNIRTAFSLLFPPILAEFGWSRGETAAAFSLGFLVGAGVSPVIGFAMDRYGPQRVVPVSAILVAAGLALATLAARPWHLYLTLGVLVVGSVTVFTYNGHIMFLPNWFRRRRGLAFGIAFSGAGVGSIVLLPWVESIIGGSGWRYACWTLAALCLAVVLPLNFALQRSRPEDLGLNPDGDAGPAVRPADAPAQRHLGASESLWTLRRAMASAPFWWIAGGYFCGLFAWYAVQVHQTKYLIEIGIGPRAAAYALGFVGLCGIGGQLGLGALADRIGRAQVWTLAASGFLATYLLLLAMERHPAPLLLWAMVLAQGAVGYGMASVYGMIPAEFFQGRSFGSIFGVISLIGNLGAGAGPWVAGLSRDLQGSYAPAWWLSVGVTMASIVCIRVAARWRPLHLQQGPARSG